MTNTNSFVCERNEQNFPIHVIRALYIDVSSYLTLTIQASSRLKALGKKGVFYSDKKISMLHFCT
jgi:hypothetical protein